MERSTLEIPSWISTFCRDFSVATGWPVTYTPNTAGETESSSMLSNPECCWSKEIQSGDETVGHLHIDLPRDPGLDQSFLAVCDLGSLFAQLAGRVLTASQSLESVTRDVSTLTDVGLEVPGDDFVATLQKLLNAATQLSEFRSAAFMLLDPKTNQLTLRVSHALKAEEFPRPSRSLSESSPDRQSLQGEPVLICKSRSPEQADWLPVGYSTGFCVPVQSDAGFLGTLWTFDRRDRVPTDRECHVLQSLAARIATTLERIVLLRESEIQHRQQHDLNIASESQFTDVLRELPNDCGFDISAVCTSRFELGGDLCELIPLDETRTLLAIGDASGDSVPAAMVMSAVRGAMRALSSADASEENPTEKMMAQINHTLHQITPSHQFMSLLIGIFDREKKTFLYTNAGHPAPIVVRGKETITLDSHGMLLGVLDKSEYTHSLLQLEKDDILIAFSDGISEAMSDRKSMFRQDGIAASIMPPGDRTAYELLQAIWSKMELHIKGSNNGDDRTLLVLRMPG